ncbi:MAG: N,N-dimethylformamidase beta subunit family domain-containing protein [Solirubrobacteraceae bacterium]
MKGLALAVSSVLLLTAIGVATPSAALAANPIQIENAKAGDSYWTAATRNPGTAIEGYTSTNSVRPGQSIGFHVSTSRAARYRIEIDRLGWYGGSGGRRVTCLVGSSLDPTCATDKPGVHQPAAPPPDPVTGRLDAGWSQTDKLAVSTHWTSGYYLAVFRLTSGPSAGQTGFTPFIVQAPTGDHAAILVQVPDNTWQAYNTWGGENLYTSPRAVKVSINRPYALAGPTAAGAGRGGGLFNWEYPLVRFLERGGWDVSFATDDDVDQDPSILLHHALDMTAGHDEYWSKPMRDGWEAARAAGVNLAFMGANTGYWQIRYEDAGRTIVSYKYSPDPDPDLTNKTVQFRQLPVPRPECALEGVQFGGNVSYGQYFDYTIDPGGAKDPWFTGSGLLTGAVLAGLVGYETDTVAPRCHVPPVTPLLSSYGPPPAVGKPSVTAESVRYTACSGAEVFSAGSLQFSWGLDAWRAPSYWQSGLPPPPPASPGLQQAMTRALLDLSHSHVPKLGPPKICVPTPRFTASMTRPAIGQPVVFTSTARDKYGQLAGQAWDLNGSARFQDGAGLTATRTFSSPGVFRVGLRVTDASGASATTTRTLLVCRCPAAWPGRGWGARNCNGPSFGALVTLKGGLGFQPDPGIGRITVRTYALALSTNGLAQRILLSSAIARAAKVINIRAARSPTLIDLATRIAGATIDQEFLLAARKPHRHPSAGVISSTACDGTAAGMLTPLFGGTRTAPLRVAVTGWGRILVSVGRPGRAPQAVRMVKGRNRPVVVAFGARRLSRGAYSVTVSRRRNGVRERIVLTALRV